MVYLSFAFIAIKMLFKERESSGGNSNETMVGELLSKPFGQWLIGFIAIAIAGVGIYQAYYGFSGKYKKHVTNLNLYSGKSEYLLKAGKIGYVSRGIVWLIIAFLMLKAALHANAKEAGDTAKAFQFLESASYGSALLGALGIGLILYGAFNFIRARYESFNG
jgi:hypothetical protein